MRGVLLKTKRHLIRPPLCFMIIGCVLCGMHTAAMTAADKEEYERRGLSQTEWEMVLDARMPPEKVDEILTAGISISEYFRYPWINYGISEAEWIRSRRSGLLESDIAAENRQKGPPEGAIVVSAFLLPGYHQFKRHQYWKGAIMTGASAFAAIYTTARSVQKGALIPHLLFIFLAPAMVWSSVDIGFEVMKERNPDATRFTYDDGGPPVRTAISIQLR